VGKHTRINDDNQMYYTCSTLRLWRFLSMATAQRA